MEPIKAEIYKEHPIEVSHGVLNSTDKSGYVSDYRIYIDGKDMTHEVRQISNQTDSGNPDLLLCRAREIVDRLPASKSGVNVENANEVHTLQAPADIGNDADKELFGNHDTGEDVGPVG